MDYNGNTVVGYTSVFTKLRVKYEVRRKSLVMYMVSRDEVTFYYYRLEYKKKTNYFMYIRIYFVLDNKIANKV